MLGILFVVVRQGYICRILWWWGGRVMAARDKMINKDAGGKMKMGKGIKGKIK